MPNAFRFLEIAFIYVIISLFSRISNNFHEKSIEHQSFVFIVYTNSRLCRRTRASIMKTQEKGQSLNCSKTNLRLFQRRIIIFRYPIDKRIMRAIMIQNVRFRKLNLQGEVKFLTGGNGEIRSPRAKADSVQFRSRRYSPDERRKNSVFFRAHSV